MFLLASCADLDLNPLSTASSGTWYSSEEEFEMSLNDLLRSDFFPIDNETWDDDLLCRDGSNMITTGTMTSQDGTVLTRWQNHYKAISRALKVLANIDKGRSMGISEEKLRQYEGEAYFSIGFAYGMLASYWGDVILDKTGMSLDEMYHAVRSPKREVLDYAYECLENAAERLPLTCSGLQRPTAGAALGFLVRFSLFNGDYEICADAAQRCMGLEVYELHPNYQDLFTANSSKEWMFYFKGDLTLKVAYSICYNVKNLVLRKLGGYCNRTPSYQLACAYTCTDGLPIDESPLYNPRDPFANRDPRMAYTIQPFKTKYSEDYAEYEASKLDGTFPQKYPDYISLGYEYAPGPYSTKVYEVASNSMVSNSDSKASNEHAAYNGLLLRKFVKDNWKDYALYENMSDNTFPYLRYAEVLLSYAEAMIELDECTQDILDETINKVRERAYAGTGIDYPRVTMASQEELRKIIRMERRVEFPFEGIRYRDLLRWRVAEKVFNIPQYYLSRAWSGSVDWNGKTGAESNINLSEDFQVLLKNWDEGNYPFGGIPQIDEDGIPDISYMKDQNLIVEFYQMSFDPEKNYLWPIPADDLLVNPNLTQNPKY